MHSHLEYIPIAAVMLVTLLHWDAFLGLIGIDVRDGAFELSRRRDPIPSPYLVAVLAPVLLIQGGVLTEEFIRPQQRKRP